MPNYLAFESVRRVGILGTGTIGASWATYFLAQGIAVNAWDPADGWRDRLIAFIENAWPQMECLGLASGADPAAITFCDTPSTAVAVAHFVQENVPEKIEVKRDLYRLIDNALSEDVILSSSTSGLIMSDLQSGFVSAPRFVVGHPFNPPHLIPLVEVVAGKDTDPVAADWAIGFYKHIGKHAIRVKKEVPGHLANRLQAALWREAVMAVKNDLATVEDINAAVAQGPGLRWGLMGPHMIMNLAGGKAGFHQMIEHFGPGMQSWWQTMNENPVLKGDLVDAIAEGLVEEAGDRTIDDLEAERDERLIRVLTVLRETARY